jgi:hypothetical protein
LRSYALRLSGSMCNLPLTQTTHCSLFVLMSQAPSDEAYTLGLLVDLRDLCRKIGDSHFRMASELHDLLRKVAHPNVSDVDKELTFRVQQQAFGDTVKRSALFRSTVIKTWRSPHSMQPSDATRMKDGFCYGAPTL